MGAQVEAVLNLLGLAIGIACAVIWIISLAKWDGKGCKPGEDCETCPFPCEEYKKRNGGE